MFATRLPPRMCRKLGKRQHLSVFQTARQLSTKIDVAVVGGGVSGLCAAKVAADEGRSVILLEARDRLGGRVYSSEDVASADLGAAWVWDGDTHVRDLAASVGAELQPQYGQMVGTPGQRYRFTGGASTFIRKLSRSLPAGSIRMRSSVRSVVRSPDSVSLTMNDGTDLTARAVVLAMPPQLAVRLHYDPELSPALVETMRAQPTFYATAAKACLAYSMRDAFWRVDSALGTLPTSEVAYELYDSSCSDADKSCLVAFIDASKGLSSSDEIRDHLLDLLVSRYGNVARQYAVFDCVLWSNEPFTTADPMQPRDVMPQVARQLSLGVDGRLFFAGTETSSDNGSIGKLESAVMSGIRAGRLAAKAIYAE